MSQGWYYKLDGEERGPVPAAELKRLAATGKLGPDALVRREDMTKWMSAGQVKGLFATTAATATSQTEPAPRLAKPVARPVPLPRPTQPDDEDAGPPATARREAPVGRGTRTPVVIAVAAGGLLLLALVVTGAVLLLSGKRGGDNADPQARGPGANNGGVKNPDAPGMADRPDPRFADAAKADPLPDFKVGPGGEEMGSKEWTQDGYKFKAQGFQRGGRFVQHGLATVWYPSGEKSKEEYWLNGKLHGPITGWYRNGQKEIEGTNKDGFGDGYSVGWYEEGGKKFERVFRNRRLDGLYLTYYRNGTVMRESEYETRKEIGVVMKAEQWFDAKGGKADGPTLPALTKLDFAEVLEYRLKHSPNPALNVVQGRITPPTPKNGQPSYEVLANFDFDYYMRFLGPPEAGFNPDFVKQADQEWTYTCLDGPLRLFVTCGRPIAGKDGVVPGKAERVIIKRTNL